MNFKKKQVFWAFVMLSPWLFRLVFITIGPMASSLYYSFTKYPILSDPKWIGLKNYIIMFTEDPLFYKSLGNTLYYTMISVPLNLTVALGIAMLLNQKIRGVNVFRTIIYVPVMIPIVVSASLFMWIFNSEVGLSSILFNLFGAESPMWFREPHLAKPALIIMNLWYLGRPMAIFLAGLQGIPKQLYEAAEIDGAGSVRKFFNIVIPIMSPIIFFNLIMGVIDSFQVFTPAFIITKGGPLNSTNFFMFHLYKQAFSFFKMGYASALSWVLFIIILVMTLMISRSSRNRVFYQS